MAIELIALISREAARLINQHYWDVILNRVSQTICLANQLLFLAI